MSRLRNRLSRSGLGGHINGLSTSYMLTARALHVFGLCSIVVGVDRLPSGGMLPAARCWICGKDHPEHRPSYDEIAEHIRKMDI